MVVLFGTLVDLWRLLDRRGKAVCGLLVGLLVVSGALEMASMVFLFGYIDSVSSLGESGTGAAKLYHALSGGREGASFAVAAGIVLVTVFVVKNTVGLLASFYLMRFAMKRYQQIATRLFEGFLRTRYEIFSRHGTLAPQQTLMSVSNIFRESFTPALEALSDITIFLTMLIALMFVLDPWLVLIAGAVLGTAGAAFLGLTRRASTSLGMRRIAADRALHETMLDGFRGLIDLRLGGRLETIGARFGRVSGEFALTDRRARALDLVPRALNEILLAVGIVAAAVYFAASPGGIGNAMPALAVMGFAGLRMTAAMSRLSGALQRMREGEQARGKLMAAIRDKAPALLSGQGPAPEDYLAEDRPLPPGCSGRLTERLAVERVSFTYPDAAESAIRDMSVEIRRGSFVGLCGPSGGGKSTLALVMMGLIRPQQGRVLCDDWDVFAHLGAWHGNIGYVGQAPFISPRSIRENVAFGYEPGEIDDARVWRALETASLAEVIRSRPEGLEAQIGEEGIRLSGGQRQRLIIARALYRDPEVLVFDEATAALDNVTEKEVSEAIAAMGGTKTIICIAHRLTTIRGADVIHYVEDGRIAASGTYRELERGCPGFRRMARGMETDLAMGGG